MVHAVVVGAQQHEVVEVGGAAVFPVPQVMGSFPVAAEGRELEHQPRLIHPAPAATALFVSGGGEG